MADGELVLPVVAGLGQVVDGLAAGVWQAEHARSLVKALAGRIVARGAEDAQVGIVAHVADERVAARNSQAHERRLQLRVGDVVGRDVAGHDAAVNGVQVSLGKDLIGQHLAPVAHEGDGRLVTGGFNRKNNHIVSASLRNQVMRSASSSGF